MRASEQLIAVFHRIDITPAGPVSLLGYFNDRVSTGVLDPLACRLAGFAARPAAAARPPGHGSRFAARRERGHLPASLGGVRRLLFLQIDTCLFDTAFLWALHRALRARGKTVRKTVDCLIATFCILNDHVLLHADSDFDHFEKELGLKALHPEHA